MDIFWLRISMDRISDSPACVTQSGRDSEEVGLIFGSVVQWIVFQIPILKMQVRFLPGSLKVPCLRDAVRQGFLQESPVKDKVIFLGFAFFYSSH